jgi:hypothetical protein
MIVYIFEHVPMEVHLMTHRSWLGGNSTPWMNLLHFMWGVGSFMSPLLLAFLSLPSSFRVVAACGAASAVLPLLLPSPATRNPAKLAERQVRKMPSWPRSWANFSLL